MHTRCSLHSLPAALTKALVFTGRYSYGLYVYQALLLPWLWRIDLATTFQRGTKSQIVGAGVYLVVSMVIMYAVAIPSFELFEKPIQKLKRNFER